MFAGSIVSFNALEQFFPFFSRISLLASKNNHESLHPCSSKHSVRVMGIKINNFYLKYDFR